MTTIDVSHTPAVVDDGGTTSLIHVTNTGDRDCILEPMGRLLRAGESATLYPNHAGITALCWPADDTTTLEVTTNSVERVVAPTTGVLVPDINMGYGGGFGFSCSNYVMPGGSGSNFPMQKLYRLSVANDNDGTTDDVDDEWMTAIAGAGHFFVKKAGWYMGAASFAVASFGDDPTVGNRTVSAYAGTGWISAVVRDGDHYGMFTPQGSFLTYITPQDQCSAQWYIYPAPEDELTVGFDSVFLTLIPVALT